MLITDLLTGQACYVYERNILGFFQFFQFNCLCPKEE